MALRAEHLQPAPGGCRRDAEKQAVINYRADKSLLFRGFQRLKQRCMYIFICIYHIYVDICNNVIYNIYNVM